MPAKHISPHSVYILSREISVTEFVELRAPNVAEAKRLADTLGFLYRCSECTTRWKVIKKNTPGTLGPDKGPSLDTRRKG